PHRPIFGHTARPDPTPANPRPRLDLRHPRRITRKHEIRAVWRRQCPQAALMVFAFALTGRSLVRWWSAARCAANLEQLSELHRRFDDEPPDRRIISHLGPVPIGRVAKACRVFCLAE